MKNAFATAIMILTMITFGVVATVALAELVKVVKDYYQLQHEIQFDIMRRGRSLRIST